MDNQTIEKIMEIPSDTVVVEGSEISKIQHMLTPVHLKTVVRNPKDADHIWHVLHEEYPQDFKLDLILPDIQNGHKTSSINLSDLENGKVSVDDAELLIIPPLPAEDSFEYFQNIVAILRAPGGCPWDRKQTHQSLRDDFLQEVYELLGALDRADKDDTAEELGDVLLHIVMQAQISVESNEFNMGDACRHISQKLIFRHPHVFTTGENLTSDQVLQRWEQRKKEERQKENKTQGLLDGINQAMPALSMADSYQKRAARVGFDWENVDGVWQKLDEEINEFKKASTPEQKEEELGDILFCIVNLARWSKVDSETALRMSNLKFYNRVHYVENKSREIGKDLFDMPLEEKDKYWEEYKNNAETKK